MRRGGGRGGEGKTEKRGGREEWGHLYQETIASVHGNLYL